MLQPGSVRKQIRPGPARTTDARLEPLAPGTSGPLRLGPRGPVE